MPAEKAATGRNSLHPAHAWRASPLDGRRRADHNLLMLSELVRRPLWGTAVALRFAIPQFSSTKEKAAWAPTEGARNEQKEALPPRDPRPCDVCRVSRLLDVAERVTLQRPAVSKMERKADMSISRFTELVEALGGGWQIRIWFEGGREHSTGVETQVARRHAGG